MKWQSTPLPLAWYLSPSSESDRVSLGHLAILTSQDSFILIRLYPWSLHDSPVSPELHERQKVQTIHSVYLKEVDMCELSPVQKLTVVRKK